MKKSARGENFDSGAFVNLTLSFISKNLKKYGRTEPGAFAGY
jgi:hypothetical protein